MAWNEWSTERLWKWNSLDQRDAEALLAAAGLAFDAPAPDLLLIARDGSGTAIGTGALAGSVLKQLVVTENYRGTGLFAELVTTLLEEAASRGRYRLFVFTKPDTMQLFGGLGFRLIEATATVALLEYGHPGFSNYLAKLHQSYRSGDHIAALVMNCNPFTLGHQYLIATAAAATDAVHLFVVSEDRSLFPTATRLRLVRAGVTNLNNVLVHEGGPYMISSATFPNYFLRQPGTATRGQAELDATIFANHIAPVLGISERFIGEEPLDPTTAAYNQALLRILPAAGVKVNVVARKTLADQPISASVVRQAIRATNWSLLEQLVPTSTLEFLQSPEAAPILQRIRQNDTPH